VLVILLEGKNLFYGGGENFKQNSLRLDAEGIQGDSRGKGKVFIEEKKGKFKNLQMKTGRDLMFWEMPISRGRGGGEGEISISSRERKRTV